MNLAEQHELVNWSGLLLACVLPAMLLLLIVQGRRLRTGFFALPVLVVMGWVAGCQHYVRYGAVLDIAEAQVHPDPDALVGHDPKGALILLFFGWLYPLIPCLFTLLAVFVTRAVQARLHRGRSSELSRTA